MPLHTGTKVKVLDINGNIYVGIVESSDAKGDIIININGGLNNGGFNIVFPVEAASNGTIFEIDETEYNLSKE